jgi:hypothetical protein
MFSAIFASMNREKALEESLPSWTKINKIKDFVIVDWSSSEPLIENRIIKEQINKYGNIKIIRVENQKYFYRCLAWNLAFQNTDPENKILIKLDAEHYNRRTSQFCGRGSGCCLDNLSLTEDKTLKNCFYVGNIDLDYKLYGFLIVNKQHFNEGYNENIDAIWGFEDADLYDRIQKKYNIKIKKSIGSDYIFHIPHSEELRFENLKSGIKYIWRDEINLGTNFNEKYQFTDIGKDGKRLQTRTQCKNFHEWVPAKYTVLEDSPIYKRVELIEQ